MNNTYKVVELSEQYRVEIFYDDQAESPDQWEDKGLFLVHDHRQFSVTREGFDPQDIVEYLRKQEDARDYSDYHIFPVAAYIHSGIVLSLGSGSHFPDQSWDVSHCGFVLVAKKEWTEPDAARMVAEGLIEEWNIYLSGQVYGFKLLKKEPWVKHFPDGRKEEGCDWEEEESCWGFYGEEGIEQILGECKAHIS